MRVDTPAVTVGDFATPRLLACPPETPLAEAAARMRAAAVSSVLVLEAGQPVGIWTERDARHLDLTDPGIFERPLAAVMSRPLHTIAATASPEAAVARLREAGIRHLLVTDDAGQPTGIVTQTDLALRHGIEHFLRLRLVAEVAMTAVPRLPGGLPAHEAARRMAAADRDAALVERSDGSLGILTERDLLALVADRQRGASLCEVASFPLRTIAAQHSLLEARRALVEGHVRHLGVTDAQGRVVGLLSMRELIAMIEQGQAAELASALQQRETQLLHSRADLVLARQIIDSSGSAVLVVGEDGRVVSANPAFARLTGVAVETAIGARPDELLACDTRGQGDLCAALCARASREDGWRGELWCRCQDGRPRAFAFSVHVLRHEGRPTGQHALVFHDASARLLAQEELRRSEARYRSLVENLPLGITVMDRDYRILYTNSAFDTLLGKPPGWFVGRLCHEEYEGRAQPCPHCPGTLAMTRGVPSEVETRGLRGDGSMIDVRNRAIPQLDESGAVTGFIEIVEDITARKQAEASLRLAASVFTHAREGILITDPEGSIVDVNDAFCRITGYAREEMLGRSPATLKSGRQGREFYAAMWRRLAEHGHWSGELWNRRKDGTEYAEHLTISAVRDEAGNTRHYVGLFSDITAQKTHEYELERVAHHDALTGLPNRALLADRMGLAMAHSRRTGETLAVCLLDLDGFKPVNDRLGHKAGDRLLQEIALRLLGCIREEDTAARLGGDEFVLLLGGFREERAYEDILRRLGAAIARPVRIDGESVQVSASIGVTLYPFDPADADQLLRHADQAMYQAKAEGKGVHRLFNPASESRQRANQCLLGTIEAAIAQGQFELHYQPKVDCRAARVVGVEALLRWNHPVLGMRSPAEFLPLIEQEDLVARLGEWVIGTALKQMATWLEAGVVLPVSVNIAARHFMHGDLAGYLAARLADAPPELGRMLCIELVETAALEDVQAVRRLMARFQPAGIGFALDDFGTGYSTLLHLKQLPVDELKIDLAFIRDMLEDPDDLAIVDGIVGLARAFGRRVVAEGVERIEQILMLLELGCDVVQGHAVAPPMPAARLESWLARFQPDPRWSIAGKDYPLRADFELLLLEVGHRHWFERLIHGPPRGLSASDLAYDHCPLAQWLAARQPLRQDGSEDWQDLMRQHRRLHVLAEQLVAVRRDSDPGLAETRAALEAGHADFMRRLRTLRAVPQRTARRSPS